MPGVCVFLGEDRFGRVVKHFLNIREEYRPLQILKVGDLLLCRIRVIRVSKDTSNENGTPQEKNVCTTSRQRRCADS